MSTEIMEISTKVESSSEQLKAILANLNDHSSSMKTLMNSVRMVLKDVDKQGKELDKLRNKKSRNTSERKLNGLPSGITKPVAISDELSQFLGVEIGTLVPRNEVTKGVSSYVRTHELSDPTNKQKFVLTSKPEGAILKKLLGNPTEEVTYFNLQRYLKHHYLPLVTSELKPTATVVVTTETKPTETKPTVSTPTVSTSETVAPTKKKTIMVKKKVSQELTEEA
jgi:chromatin remodeling complex protein RSC6